MLEYPSISDERYVNELSKEIGTYVIKGFNMVIIDSVTPALKTLSNYAKNGHGSTQYFTASLKT